MLRTRCQLCKGGMVIERPFEPLDPYIAALGFKHTGRWWHNGCWQVMLKRNGWI